jgi:hypothetical protein
MYESCGSYGQGMFEIFSFLFVPLRGRRSSAEPFKEYICIDDCGREIDAYIAAEQPDTC